MSAVISISTGKTYGVSRVCRAWGLSHASVYRDVRPLRNDRIPCCAWVGYSFLKLLRMM